MGFFSFLFTRSSEISGSEIPEIFPISLKQNDFTFTDLLSTYTKILTDAMERTHGLPAPLHPLLWDSCVQSEANEGLISLLACAMVKQSDLFLVYSKSTKVLRKATPEEEEQIKKDYKERAESSVGVFISFKKYIKTEILLVYSGFEFCVLSSLNKSLNVAKAVQIKVNELRTSVSLNDSAIAKEQARSIACALSKGNDVMLDAKDTIETADVDTEPTENAVNFLDEKKAFILGLPVSYLSGEQTSGIGATGEADTKAVERGLKPYWFSILRPVIKALFGKDTEFKTHDFRQINSALETLKTFDLCSNDFLSSESKQEIMARMFELDADEESKKIEKEDKEEALDEENPPVNPEPNNNNKQSGNGSQRRSS